MAQLRVGADVAGSIVEAGDLVEVHEYRMEERHMVCHMASEVVVSWQKEGSEADAKKSEKEYAAQGQVMGHSDSVPAVLPQTQEFQCSA